MPSTPMKTARVAAKTPTWASMREEFLPSSDLMNNSVDAIVHGSMKPSRPSPTGSTTRFHQVSSISPSAHDPVTEPLNGRDNPLLIDRPRIVEHPRLGLFMRHVGRFYPFLALDQRLDGLRASGAAHALDFQRCRLHDFLPCSKSARNAAEFAALPKWCRYSERRGPGRRP